MNSFSDLYSPPPTSRRIFCNRTLNLRSIKAIGYDMDYTLIHYRVEEWESCAYAHIQKALVGLNWPVEELEFDPELVTRGLIIDTELGNIVKCNRFGYVKQAMHGTRGLSFDETRKNYAGNRVGLSEDRYTFLNTLFSISEGSLFLQLVDLYDEDRLPGIEHLGYRGLWKRIRSATDAAHMEGHLKAEIIANPDRFLDLDPELPLALLDQRHAGKVLLLITNSEWSYTAPLMSYSFDRFLPDDMTWRDLFDYKIISARKPSFWTDQNPCFEVVDEEGLLRPAHGLSRGGTFLGANASMIEEELGFSGDEFLYVGDHIFTDISASKRQFSWRTALVLRELEPEIEALASFREKQARLETLMQEKVRLEAASSTYRLLLRRRRLDYGPKGELSSRELNRKIARARERLSALDTEITPLAIEAGNLDNPRWGLLLRAGNDKSHMARQIEAWADIYTSRVSNFLHATPFVYLRSPRGSLPHDPQLGLENPFDCAPPSEISLVEPSE